MTYNLYSVQDTLVGFMPPFKMPNEATAIRAYENFLKTADNPGDLRLFHVGTFDDDTGVLESMIPKCIMGGGTNGD